MEHLAPAPAGSRVNPSSSDDLGTTDAAESMVAHDVEARVGEEFKNGKRDLRLIT